VNAQQQAALICPIRDAAPWEALPLSRSTGGRNLAHNMGAHGSRKRRLNWRLPRSVLQMLASALMGALFFGGLWAWYTWG
jgi:hypothetical protein